MNDVKALSSMAEPTAHNSADAGSIPAEPTILAKLLDQLILVWSAVFGIAVIVLIVAVGLAVSTPQLPYLPEGPIHPR